MALAAGTVLLLAGCGGDAETEEESAAPPPSAKDRLEQAHEVVTDAGSLHLAMVAEDPPQEASTYVVSAEGDGTMDPPAFDGEITARLAGVQADVPAIAVDGELWVELPYTSRYVQTDPADLGAPDPATLFDPEQGLVGLLTRTDAPEFGDRTRAEDEIVQNVTGTLDGQLIVDLLRTGDAGATFDVTYGLVEESWEVRTVTITGPFYPPETSTYRLTLDAYGEPVTVERP